MKIFFTSDHHLGDPRLDLLGRPFKTCLQAVDIMVDRHNSMVGEQDLVIFNGDVVYDKDYLKMVSWFAGKKILIRGNYDRQFTDEELRSYFGHIVAEGDGLPIRIKGKDMWVTHYPTRGCRDKFNLVGHIHGAWKVQLNMLNVGVDVHHFTPVPEERVDFYYKQICDHLDDDAWIAYSSINLDYIDTRGKEGNYLDKHLNPQKAGA